MNAIHIPGPKPPSVYQELIDDYLLSLRQVGRSKATIRSYGWQLYHMAIWIYDHGYRDGPECITRRVLREWGGSLWDRYKPETIKQAICAARDFFRWLVEEEILDTNPARTIKPPTTCIRPQRTLSADEIYALLKACNNSPKGIRDAAIVALLVDSGLRSSELCRLTLPDLSLDTSRLQVYGKGGRYETAYFSTSCKARLERWLKVRGNHVKPDFEEVFIAIGGLTPGAPLTPRGLRLILKKLGEKAGVPRVHPHAFRRSFATLAIKAGAPTRVVQILGRWKDIKLVERYTAILECEDASRLHAAYSPLSHLSQP